MSQTIRLREIISTLQNSHYPVPRERFLTDLQVSLATFKRDLTYLRDQLQAPIVWKEGGPGAAERGYVLEDKGWSSGKLGLPNAWFSSSELYALLMIPAQSFAPGFQAHRHG